MSTTLSTTVRDEFAIYAADLLASDEHDVTVVLVNRYNSGDYYGVHVMGHRYGARTGWIKRTLAVNVADLYDIDVVINDFWPKVEVVPFNLFEVERTRQFIYDLVIPLEWKSWSDVQLAQRLTIIRKARPSAAEFAQSMEQVRSAALKGA